MTAYKRLFPLLALMLVAMGGLSACNTMEGFGQDMEEAGDSIEDSARSNKNY